MSSKMKTSRGGTNPPARGSPSTKGSNVDRNLGEKRRKTGTKRKVSSTTSSEPRKKRVKTDNKAKLAAKLQEEVIDLDKQLAMINEKLCGKSSSDDFADSLLENDLSDIVPDDKVKRPRRSTKTKSVKKEINKPEPHAQSSVAENIATPTNNKNSANTTPSTRSRKGPKVSPRLPAPPFPLKRKVAPSQPLPRVNTKRIIKPKNPWLLCKNLLQEVKEKSGPDFFQPVDHVALRIPDYPLIIKHPMDLGTIQGKLDSGTYKHVSEFAEDVRLTFKNAMTFNPPKHIIHITAKRTLSFFERKFKPILEQENIPYEEKRKRLQELIEQAIQEKNIVHKSLEELKKEQEVSNQDTCPPIRPLEEIPKTQMNYDDRLNLSKAVNNFPTKYYPGLEAIIREIPPKYLKNEPQEIVLLIDELPPIILKRIEAYLKDCKCLVSEPPTEDTKPTQNTTKSPSPTTKNVKKESNKTKQPKQETNTKTQPNNTPQKQLKKPEIKQSPKKEESSSSSSSDSSDTSSSDSEEEFRNQKNQPVKIEMPIQQDQEMVDSPALNSSLKQTPLVLPTQKIENEKIVLLNEDSWSAFKSDKESTELNANAPGALWSEFKSRSAQNQQREREKMEREAALQQQLKEKAEVEKRSLEEAAARRKKEEEEIEKKRLEEEEVIRKEKEKEIELQREAERAKREKEAKSVNLTSQFDIMADFERGILDTPMSFDLTKLMGLKTKTEEFNLN